MWIKTESDIQVNMGNVSFIYVNKISLINDDCYSLEAKTLSLADTVSLALGTWRELSELRDEIIDRIIDGRSIDCGFYLARLRAKQSLLDQLDGREEV